MNSFDWVMFMAFLVHLFKPGKVVSPHCLEGM